MSTTRPLASEMTGTSRETSGNTAPVAFSSAGASICPAVTTGNFGTSSAGIVIRLMSGTCDHLCRRWIAIALVLSPATRKSQGNGCKQSERALRK